MSLIVVTVVNMFVTAGIWLYNLGADQNGLIISFVLIIMGEAELMMESTVFRRWLLLL